MTLQQCRYLVGISTHGSISKAAEAMFVTQPSISKAIRELESELQLTIFQRGSRGVAFTSEGLELLSYARMLVEQEQNIRARFDPGARAAVIRLSVSSQHFSFAAEAVSRMLGAWGERSYDFTFLEGKASDVVGQVSGGVSALGILAVSSLNHEFLERSFAAQSLTFTPIAALGEHVFLGQNHPLASRSVLSVEQLAPYPSLTYRRDDAPLGFAEDFAGLRNSSRVVYVQDRGTMDDLLVRTDGYNIGTGCMSDELARSGILSIPLAAPWEIRIGYIKKNAQVLCAEALRFVEYLSESVHRAMP